MFTTNGKEVLLDGQHFADATTHGDAEEIAFAMNEAYFFQGNSPLKRTTCQISLDKSEK